MTAMERAGDAVVLDNRGLEPPQPMMRILETLVRLPDDATLVAINEREPLFLYPELDARGYSHDATPHPDGSVHITICRAGAAPAPAMPPVAAATAEPLPDLVLDVRADQRRRKEPLARIMAALQELGEGQDLVIINTFEPVPLYTVLGRQGFTHSTTQVGAEEWHVRFRRGAVAG